MFIGFHVHDVYVVCICMVTYIMNVYISLAFFVLTKKEVSKSEACMGYLFYYQQGGNGSTLRYLLIMTTIGNLYPDFEVIYAI